MKQTHGRINVVLRTLKKEAMALKAKFDEGEGKHAA